MKLSVLIPGIRYWNWLKLYESIGRSFSGDWEAVIISPYELPPELLNKNNIQWIQSWRAPLACQQQGLCSAVGEYISWAADDGFYLPGALDQSFQLLEGGDYKTVIVGKYQEGNRIDDNMEKDDYYILNNHVQSAGYFIPDNTWMLNCGVVSRKILYELGGWDSLNFKVCPMGYSDLAIRLQKYGCKFILQKEMLFTCTHEPGMMGTHGPIHLAQTEFDEPRFKELYSNVTSRMAIVLENWKGAPDKFSLRFGD